MAHGKFSSHEREVNVKGGLKVIISRIKPRASNTKNNDSEIIQVVSSDSDSEDKDVSISEENATTNTDIDLSDDEIDKTFLLQEDPSLTASYQKPRNQSKADKGKVKEFNDVSIQTENIQSLPPTSKQGSNSKPQENLQCFQ